MTLTVTVGGHAQTAYLQESSATLKYNTFDCTLVDPVEIPAIGETVTLTDPAWTGTVVRLRRRTGPRIGHDYATISASNTDVAGASAGPFGLSDAPNGSTTYGYDGLTVETTENLDSSGTTHGSLTFYHGGLWPGMTFGLTSSDLGYSATSFTVTDVSVTWFRGTPRYAMDFGDALVTMSVWLNSESAGILPITRTKITDGEVTTPKLAANAVTADKLEATLVLATKIIAGTAATGVVRVEMGSEGVTAYSATDEPLVKIPTNGDPVYVAGEIEASSLTSTTQAELGGTTTIPAESLVTLAATVTKPAAAPVITQGTAGSATVSPTPGDTIDLGIAWDATSSTWYSPYWVAGEAGDCAYIREFNGTTWAVVRAVTTGLTISDIVKGVGVAASNVYLLISNIAASSLKLYKYLRSDLSLVTSATITTDAAVYNQATMFYDATADRLVVVTATGTGATRQVRFRHYNQSLALQSTLDATGLTINGTTTVMTGAVRAEGFYWVALSLDGATNAVRCFNLTTGAYVSNQDWGAVGSTYYAGCGLGHDGTQFWTRRDGATLDEVVKFTNWNWTTESAKYWVGYSWYDPDATVHETEAGPRASTTMSRRMRLQVVNASIPGAGGADDPDNVRVYMERNATQPAAGGYKLQATDALTSRYLSTFATGGAADPTSNDFPAATSAEIKSATSGWSLKGDGTVVLAEPVDYAPTITNGGTATYTTRTGQYVRLGKMVMFAIEIVVNAAGTGGGIIVVELPSTPGGTHQVCVGTGDGFTTFADGVCYGLLNTASAALAGIRDKNAISLSRAHFVSGALIRLSGWYFEA